MDYNQSVDNLSFESCNACICVNDQYRSIQVGVVAAAVTHRVGCKGLTPQTINYQQNCVKTCT